MPELFGVRGAGAGWDDPDRFDVNIDWHPHRDHGMKARCFECLNNLASPGSQRCEPCRHKHGRRLRGARDALDDA